MLKSDVQPSVLGLDTTRIAKLVNILENSTIYPLLTNILILGYFGLKKIHSQVSMRYTDTH